MKIKLKTTEELNYDEVVDIFFEVGFLKHVKKREEYKEAIEKAFRNSQYVVTAWDRDKLIGFVRVLTDDSLFATIWNMLVKPSYQGKGVGKMMMEKCFNKYSKLHFFLVADKEVSDFYKKLGFRIHPHGMYLEKGKEKCVIYN